MGFKRTLFISLCIVLVLVAMTTIASALPGFSADPNWGVCGMTYPVTLHSDVLYVGVVHPVGASFPLAPKVCLKRLTEAGTWYEIVGSDAKFVDRETIKFTLTIPATAPPGSYILYVKTGVRGWTRSPYCFTVKAALPDLTSDIYWAAGPMGSGIVKFSSRVSNVGYKEASRFRQGFYLSTDDIITEDDYIIGIRDYDKLAAGETGPTEETFGAVGSAVPVGDYYVGTIADSENQITELDEENNADVTGRGSFTILDNRADLIPSGFYVPSGITSKDFEIENCVTNRGGEAAGPFEATFYLSLDSTIETSDYAIGSRPYSSGLRDGASGGLESTSVTVPDTVPAGSYYVGMIVDSGSTVIESEEGNNDTVWERDTVTIPAPVMPPVISSISPASVVKPSTPRDPPIALRATVSGASFVQGAQVVLVNGATTIAATIDDISSSGTSIRCTLMIRSTTPVGYYTLNVQNPGTTWTPKGNAFHVGMRASAITGAGSQLGPSSPWGKRYPVGNPGSFIDTRFGSGGTSTDTGSRAAETPKPTLKPESLAYGLEPPTGQFIRWYPGARWAAEMR